jgi:hypothetical protein
MVAVENRAASMKAVNPAVFSHPVNPTAQQQPRANTSNNRFAKKAKLVAVDTGKAAPSSYTASTIPTKPLPVVREAGHQGSREHAHGDILQEQPQPQKPG